MTRTPRGIRNNNPGNIEYSPANDWKGQIGHDGRYAIFSDMKYGVRALAILLINYYQRYGLRTVRQIINRWAPPTENDTESYVNHVAERLGVEPDQMIALAPNLADLVRAIIRHENGRDIDERDLLEGVTMALQDKGL